MKFFYLCLFILFFFTACSEPSELHTSFETVSSSSHYQKDVVLEPTNALNPYDVVGQLHNELVMAFCSNDTLPTSLNGIANKVVSLAQSNSNFTALGAYSFNSIDRVSYLLTHLETSKQEVLYASLSSESARTSLSTFIDSLLRLCTVEDDYGIIYSYVIDYENFVLTKSSFTARDAKVILVTTSIARHAAYLRKKKPKKNKDPEWDYMITNIVAATDGANIGFQEAVMRSVVAGIAENY